MEPFNFAQTKLYERKFCRQRINRHMRGILVLALLTAFAASGATAVQAKVRAKASGIQSELAMVRAQCDHARKEISAAEKARRQLKWQESLTEATGVWIGILDSISKCAPDKMWLNRVQNSEKQSVVTIEGMTDSYESLSLFLSRLRTVPAISDARLRDVRVADAGGRKTVGFYAEAQIALPDKPAESQAAAQGARVPDIAGTY
jgi:Tfp pilus assembly protein PilN